MGIWWQQMGAAFLNSRKMLFEQKEQPNVSSRTNGTERANFTAVLHTLEAFLTAI